NLDEIERRVALEVPRPERARKSCSKADRIREAERRVVQETERRERPQVSMRIDSEVVVAGAGRLHSEPLERGPLRRELRVVVGRTVRRVEPDLGIDIHEGLHEPWAKLAVRLRR